MTATENQIDTPRIYVACLAAYNSGTLHGKWIEANQSEDEIWGEINAMLKASPIEDAEEHAIHDHEGFGRSVIGEYTSIETVVAYAEFINEHGELGNELLDHFCGSLEDAEKALENYAGEYQSTQEFVFEINEGCFEIPKQLKNYIDWQAMARDMDLGGDIYTVETGFQEVHIFWNH